MGAKRLCDKSSFDAFDGEGNKYRIDVEYHYDKMNGEIFNDYRLYFYGSVAVEYIKEDDVYIFHINEKLITVKRR